VWKVTAPLLPDKSRGIPRVNDRTLNSIFWRSEGVRGFLGVSMDDEMTEEKEQDDALDLALVQPILLISNGRSGSTLLMRALNSIEGVYIFGEHGGAWKHCRAILRAFSDHLPEQERNGSRILKKIEYKDRFIAWATPFGRAKLVDGLGALLTKLYTDNLPVQKKAIWGFKEIRYDADDLFLLNELWPYAKFIFLTRDIEDLFLSKAIAFNSNDISDAEIVSSVLQIQSNFSAYNAFSGLFAQRCITVDYDQLCSDPLASLQYIFSFIGVQDGCDWSSLQEIMRVKIDYVSDETKSGVQVEALRKRFRSIAGAIVSP
jgi:hypothetical protein